MSDVDFPDEKGCLALLEKHKMPAHIVRHSRMVWAVGRIIGEGLSGRQHDIDMNLLRASCLLHDIGKYPSILVGTMFHDRKGQEILVEEGLPVVGRIVARHVILGDRDGDPVKEPHVLFYADKRVVHDELVTLEGRFDYLFRTYAKTRRAQEMLQIMKDQTVALEKKIFTLLDFEPKDIESLIDWIRLADGEPA